MSLHHQAIDLRDQPPPAPYLVIMDALEQPLPPCGYLAYLLPRFPQPLLAVLEDKELAYRVEIAEDYNGILMLIGHNLPAEE